MTAVTLRQAPQPTEPQPEQDPEPQYKPRHRRGTVAPRARTPFLQRARNVSIRIPVRTGVDWVDGHAALLSAACLIATGLVLAALVPSLWMALVFAFVAAGSVSLVWWWMYMALKSDRDAIVTANKALVDRLSEVDRGAASAPTQMMHAIGDLGETS
ncbi:MAG: hypothetical protein JWO67_1562 [Streptosporangiaceae bacterium]|nr:hypothetical protein [Streptosporangiaceae bacterium]